MVHRKTDSPATGALGLLQRFSFQQLLLLGFLLVAGLLGASALQALFTLEQLMAQSRAGAASAMGMTSSAQELVRKGPALERAARQSLVLRDASLREGFSQMAVQARRELTTLQNSGLTMDQVQEWERRLQQVTTLMDVPAERALASDRQIAAEFIAIEQLHATIAQAVADINAQRGLALQQQLESSRRHATHQVVGTIVLAVALALALGIWLARPFKRMEAAIRKLGENQLDDPVQISGPQDLRRVGQQLDWLRLRLLELDEDKSRFLRHVSHELKTPLAALREGVALLQEGVTGQLTTGQLEVVHILQHNTLVLQGEIEALLQFNAAAFSARQLERRRTSLLALLEAQVEAQRLQWQAKNLTINLEGSDICLMIDSEKIGAALSNLLSNAIRFSSREGSIALSLSQSSSAVRIDVRDDGPGIDNADRPYIFDPFFRGSRQPQDAMRGTGIGLSIVREYTTAHGGTVALLDDDRGAFFRIELPHVVS